MLLVHFHHLFVWFGANLNPVCPFFDALSDKTTRETADVMFNEQGPRAKRSPALAAKVLAGSLVIVGLTTPQAVAAPPTKVAPTSFKLVGVHPQASLQPTERGRTIAALETWRGDVYAGYGDFLRNTGPIAITPFDPISSTFASAPVHTSDTEEIGMFRPISGRLYAPALDTRNETDYSVSSAKPSSQIWEQHADVSSTHVFDMATLNGSDLWMVGSEGLNAVAWRSVDGGETWTESLSVAPRAGGRFSRFYFAGAYKGKLYVQAVDVGGPQPTSMVFDGTSWSPGKSLLSYKTAVLAGHQPRTFAGKLIYQGHTWETVLLAFDGETVSSVFWDDVNAFTVHAGRLWVLTWDGKVYSTPDLQTWHQHASAPSNARSIAVVGGSIYVGTTDAALYRASVSVTQ